MLKPLTKLRRMPHPIRPSLAALCLFGLLFAFAGSANATSRVWTGNTNANWTNIGNWTNGAPVAGDDLVFSNVGTANLSNTNDFAAGTVFNSITISAGGYTLAGNSVSLTTGLTASHISGTSTVSLIIGGAGSLTMNGAGGTLTLSGANTYSGTTTVGTASASVVTCLLIISGNNSTRSNTTSIVGNLTATNILRISHSNALGTGTVTVGSGGNGDLARLELDGSAGNIAVTTALNLNASRNSVGTYASPHIVNLSGSNSLSSNLTSGSGGGQVSIRSDAGTLTLSGSITTRQLNLLGVGNGSITGTIPLQATYGIVKDGSGTWTLGNAGNTTNNTYTGGTTIVAGELVAKSATGNSLGTGAVSVATGSRLTIQDHAGGVPSIPNNFTLNGSGIGGNGALNFFNSGFGNASTGLTGTINLASDTTIRIDPVGQTSPIDFRGVISGAGSLTLFNQNSSTGTPLFKFSAANTYGTGSQNTILTSGSSTGSPMQVELAVANALPTGTTVTYGGTPAGTPTGTFNQNVTLKLNGISQTIGGVAVGVASLNTGGYSIVGNSATASALVVNNSTTNTFGGIIGGIGTNNNNIGLTKSGSGTLILSGANTYTGGTTIGGGPIQMSGATSTIGSVNNNLTINTGGALDLNGVNQGVGQLGGTSVAGNAVYNSVNSNTSTLTVGNNNATGGSFGGIIANTNSGGTGIVALIKTGTGTQTLSGTNTYTGGTTLNRGTLAVGNNSALGTGSFTMSNTTASDTTRIQSADATARTLSNAFGTFAGSTATYAFGNTTGGTGNLTFSNTTSASIGTGARTFQIDNATTEFDAGFTASGSITKTGNGTMILAGANTYSGGTTISAGIFQIGNGGTSGTLAAGVVIDNATLSFNRTNSLTVGNEISGTGTLTQAGSGTTILIATNSYVATSISAGTLQIGNAGITGTLGSGAVTNNATLSFNRTNSLTVSNDISGTGSLTQAGIGTTILAGTNSYDTTTVSTGTLQVGNAGTTGTLGSGAVTNNAALSFNRSDTITVGNAIGGTGLVRQIGGTTILTNTNTYSGKTTITGGVLSISADNNLGTAPGVATAQALTISSGTLQTTATMTLDANRSVAIDTTGRATFDVASGTTLTYGGVISNINSSFHGITKIGNGTLLLNGANTHQGSTIVNAGTLGGSGTIQGTATFASSTVHSPGNSPGIQTVAGNYTLNSGSKLQIEINGATAGTEYDQVVVNGTVTLNNPNLGFTLGFAPAADGVQTFTLIDNNLSDAVVGTFNGIKEGATFNLPFSNTNYTFQISYVGGDGNDVVLTSIPFDANSTAVDLVSFTATHYKDGLWLKWETGDEVDNLGFNVYRVQNGKKVRLNSSLIAGSALRVGNGTHLVAGGSYAWPDESGDVNSQYWLEDVDLNGTSTWHGPIKVSAANGKAALQSSPLLGASPANQAATGPFTKAVTASTVTSVEMPFVLTSIPAGNRGQQWSLAGQQAVKIAVRKTGWYRVTKSQLTAAGLDVTDFNNLQLYADGLPVPVSVGSSYFEFYGVAFDTPTTDTHIYWLVTGSGRARIASQSSGAPGATFAASFPCVVESKPRSIYYSSLLNGEAENFFGPAIYTQAVTQTLPVQNLASSGIVRLEVALQGVSSGAHQVQVQFNGKLLGTVNFTDRAHKIALLTVPLAALIAGSNSVTLTSSGGSDASLLDSLRLTYPRTYRAVNDRLIFSAKSGDTVRIAGFSLGTAPLRLVDVSDPSNPIEIQGQVQTSSSDRSLTFKASATSSRIIAFAKGQFDSPTVAANQPSDWHNAKSADLVIIAHASVKGSVEPLAALRRKQGYVVQVVDVEDIYDEFSGGAHTPQALKDFLANAKSRWQKAPRFGLLVGDSSLDPRNYGGQGDFDLVPTRLIDTATMETASDEWLADFDDNGLAEMSLGRLPVRSAGEASAIINKIVGYAGFQVKEGKKALFVSDTERGFDFNAASTTVAGLLPPTVSKQFLKRDDGDTATVKAQLIQDINQGPLLASFFGHGSIDIWTGARLLANEDASALTNSANLSVILPMTCLNGYFQDPNLDGLAEVLLKAPNGGGAAVWASSGMTNPESQLALSQEMHRQLFKQGSGKPATLGDAIKNAKATSTDSDVQRTWILFGDPTTPILAATIKTPAVTLDDVSVVEGNSGFINANFTVQLSWPSDKTISINAIPYNGSALSPSDYTGGGLRIIFAPGETTKTFSVPVKGDLQAETNETFFVVLSSPVNCSIGRGRGVGTIVNDDVLPSISIDAVRIGEGNSGQRTAAFRLKLSAPSGQVVKVNYATANGTAKSGEDYVAVPATSVAFSAGSVYAYARVLINGDLLNEADETFVVNLTTPANATIMQPQATGTILNDDSAPALSINDVSIAEGNPPSNGAPGTKNLTFTVTLSKASAQAVSVNYATANGTALSASDYAAKTGLLTFAAGQTSKTISVVINGDTIVENDETLFVLLSAGQNATIARARGIGTINNDDSSVTAN